MNIAQHLERAVRHFPERTAIIFEGQPISYAALQAQADRVAHAFSRLGITPGERITLLLPNIPNSPSPTSPFKKLPRSRSPLT